MDYRSAGMPRNIISEILWNLKTLEIFRVGQTIDAFETATLDNMETEQDRK